MSLKPYHYIISLLTAFCFITSCNKNAADQPVSEISAGTKTYSADVATRWLNMELNMFRLPLSAGTTVPSADRALAYAGITLYESVVPGMPAYQSLGVQLNQLPAMPQTQSGKSYHWAASANAALAAINRSLFPGTSQANKDSINNLEMVLQNKYAQETDAETKAGPPLD